jgi:glycosyltransferase involved in cell wall biosynthesis
MSEDSKLNGAIGVNPRALSETRLAAPPSEVMRVADQAGSATAPRAVAAVIPAAQLNRHRFAGKRVAMVSFSPYPADPRPRRAIDALVSEGATVDLICHATDGAPTSEKLNGINVLRIPLKHPRRGKLEYVARYGAFIFAASAVFAWRSLFHRYDLVYVNNMPDILVLSGLFPKLLGSKLVLDLHDPMPELAMTIFNAPPESGMVRFFKALEKWSIARTDMAITVNIACQRIFSKRSCSAEKITVVMNTPDDRIFPYRPAPSELPANQAAKKRFVVMYHGSLVERNGVDLAIDAIERVRDTVPAAELEIFGPTNPFLERVMESVRQRGLTDRVHYRGKKKLEELVSEIANCDLGVIPNHQNPFTAINTPTRIFEYLALGKPAIVPSNEGITDYFSKDALWYFDPGSAESLAKQIEYAYAHPQELLESARKAQQVYLTHTWQQEREILLSSLSGLLNGNSAN